jgi:hypothetical protein
MTILLTENRWDKQARKLLSHLIHTEEQREALKMLADALMAEYLTGFEDGTVVERKKQDE